SVPGSAVRGRAPVPVPLRQPAPLRLVARSPRPGGSGPGAGGRCARPVAPARVVERRSRDRRRLSLTGPASPLRRGPGPAEGGAGSAPPARPLPVLRRLTLDCRPPGGRGRRVWGDGRAPAARVRPLRTGMAGGPDPLSRLRGGGSREAAVVPERELPGGADRGLREVPPIRQVDRPHRRHPPDSARRPAPGPWSHRTSRLQPEWVTFIERVRIGARRGGSAAIPVRAKRSFIASAGEGASLGGEGSIGMAAPSSLHQEG